MNGEELKKRHRKYVSYLRVSTARQGESGLGLDAQRAAVATYLSGARHKQLREFVEVESGKGVNALDRRPALREALDYCKEHGAVLVIATLDRLARNVAFVASLMESGAEFVAADIPQADKFMLHVYAAIGEHERDRIAERTRAALAAAKKRGVRLGNPRLRKNREILRKNALVFAEHLRPVLTELQQQGLSQRAMVAELNHRRILTRQGKYWSLAQLQRTLRRIGSVS